MSNDLLTESPPPGQQPEFDLTTRPWIRVLRPNGTEDELSLRQVFHQAPHLVRLVGDLPTQEFALIRLLLAILHDAVDGPESAEDWHELWEADTLPCERIDDYLDRHRERFDLLHPQTPFFQVAKLHTSKNEYSSLDRLVADVPNGNRFFTMRAHGAQRLDFAEAARWLVHAQAFDTSGIKSGAAGDDRVKGGKGYPQGVAWAGNLGGVMVQAANLRESLLLNLVATEYDHIRADDADAPAWRHAPVGPGPLKPVEAAYRPHGVRDLYTWQSRRVRLHFDAEGAYGVLLSYGDPLTPHEHRHRQEPMTGWRRSQAQEKKHKMPLVYMPREHDPTRSAWRGLASLITDRVRGKADDFVRPRVVDWVAWLATEGFLEEKDKRVRARLIGARYGTQQSVIDEVVDDDMNMAVALLDDHHEGLRQQAINAVDDAHRAVEILGTLAHDLARAAGTEPGPRRDAARDRGYGQLDAPYRRWVGSLDSATDPDQARAEWQRTLRDQIRRIGDELADAAGPSAWEGRVIEAGAADLWLSTPQAKSRFQRELARLLPYTAPAPTN
ncbi:type I-E CRISPR-associated protein Cse1/CasA [Nocardiopsis lucentensis]|uniref:type I-E CRISPR-associated protein Cse1/CasA n=1 Tax=Nocardiopsis lucentensis TaxID=53441 RepID=UPI000348190A|nr:type I-E CRISPR-associated protein Cse1/CasA [Nocardiopsis lucentensis]